MLTSTKKCTYISWDKFSAILQTVFGGFGSCGGLLLYRCLHLCPFVRFFSFLVIQRLSIVGDDLTAVGTSRRFRVYIIDNAPDMENMKWVGREMESIRGEEKWTPNLACIHIPVNPTVVKAETKSVLRWKPNFLFRICTLVQNKVWRSYSRWRLNEKVQKYQAPTHANILPRTPNFYFTNLPLHLHPLLHGLRLHLRIPLIRKIVPQARNPIIHPIDIKPIPLISLSPRFPHNRNQLTASHSATQSPLSPSPHPSSRAAPPGFLIASYWAFYQFAP